MYSKIINITLTEEEEDWLFEIIFTAHDFQDPWGVEAYDSICAKLRRNREGSTLILSLITEEIDAMEERLKDDLK